MRKAAQRKRNTKALSRAKLVWRLLGPPDDGRSTKLLTACCLTGETCGTIGPH
jgi:hypothetical protein